jgi:hypothetical protein
MKVSSEPPSHDPEGPAFWNETAETRKAVLQELENILASPSFRSASRSRQFLKYVVEHQLEGRAELLKERVIGTEVFQRPAGYATGDDPVVRVQAGEVRRRLDKYYQATPNGSHLRIELPLGSYSPHFHFPESSLPTALVEKEEREFRIPAGKEDGGGPWLLRPLYS